MFKQIYDIRGIGLSSMNITMNDAFTLKFLLGTIFNFSQYIRVTTD